MFLGLDLGTSGVKAMLIDAEQRVVASHSAPLSVDRPHPGWSEQDPADWIAACEAAIGQLREVHAPALAVVEGIGLSGQMHGATLLDRAGHVLRPCILWNDVRSHVEAAELDADPRFRQITGNIVFPGFTAPKIAWLRRHEPELFDAIASILLPKDYLRFWLTGERISDLSDASGTAWLDVAARTWSPELVDACGLDMACLPALVEGSAPAGRLRREIAVRLGINPDAVIAGGAGDNAASACGMGVIEPGRAFVSLGTSGVLFAATDGYRPDAASAVHTFCHALPGLWHQMGVTLSATDSLNWFAGLVEATPADLVERLGHEVVAPSSVLFLPYLSGERTPHNDAATRGAFLGLGHESGREELTRAVMEGVAFAFRDSLAALAACGARPDRVMAVGGGARSQYWVSLLATVLDLPIDVPAAGDFGAAFGAARLGMIAATNGDPLTICTPPRIERTVIPTNAHRAAFDAAYLRYRSAYPAIRGVNS
jgi:xylulokinase